MSQKKHFIFLTAFFLIACSSCGVREMLPFLRTPTPTRTATPPPTPTPRPTFTPRPTPTPVTPPTKSSLAGDVAFFYGDWESALTEYQQTLENDPSPTEKNGAMLGLGKTYYQLRNYPTALDTLRNLLISAPDSAHTAEAQFVLAQTYTALDRHLEAASAYEAYLTYNPGVIDAYVQERRGDAYTAAGKYLASIEAYQAAIAAGSVNDSLLVQFKIGQAYAALEDYPTAALIFQEIYDKTTNDYLKASADYQRGQIFTAMERPDQAQAAYRDAVEKYPLSYDTYLSLVELVREGYQVSDLDRGLVDYFAGKYALAIDAFNRYLGQDEVEDPGTAYYYLGKALRNSGKAEDALYAWDQIIESYPEDEYWDEAWEFKAYTEWFYLDRYSRAVQTLTGFVEESPHHPRAAEFLFDAARVEERDQDYPEAIALWERVIAEFPTSQYANQALFLIGITHFRLEAHSQAQEVFARYVASSPTEGELAKAYFWLGKAHQAGGEEVPAQVAWEQAVNADPTGYYSERAQDLLLDRDAFDSPLNYDLSSDVDAEREEAEAWMRETFAIPPVTNLRGLGYLAEDERLIRGTELWNLGLYSEARLEFEDLRNEVSYDPVSCYRLANYLVDLGLYRSAIFAARQVLNLAGMDDAGTMNAPAYFNHIRFGSYYRDLIFPAAEEYGFHPLFLFSVIRQESLFEAFVTSSQDAGGLMQILPSTGANVAKEAGWPPNYSAEDLYRPYVNVRLGTAYLASMRRIFDGKLYVALAAYNGGGGPGRAIIWLERAPTDIDLFYETIHLSETQRYLKGIKEVFAIYRRLYGREE
ncbi:MAG: Soluble lytic murein transglycosylase [Chloroflexi bacterium]|nr:Soluble lytic murein transglycosylase [Chloroflexota bacterium]